MLYSKPMELLRCAVERSASFSQLIINPSVWEGVSFSYPKSTWGPLASARPLSSGRPRDCISDSAKSFRFPLRNWKVVFRDSHLQWWVQWRAAEPPWVPMCTEKQRAGRERSAGPQREAERIGRGWHQLLILHFSQALVLSPFFEDPRFFLKLAWVGGCYLQPNEC